MAASVAFRSGRPDDHDPLLALTWRASLANSEDGEQLLAHPEAVEGPREALARGVVVVAEHDGRPIGYASAVPAEASAFEIDGLFVEPEFWRQGVGGRLLAEALAALQAQGAAVVTVVAHPRALSVYESAGFQTIGPATTRFGPAVAMRRPLGEASA